MTRWTAKSWLAAFRAVGGMAWIPAGNDRLCLAWMVEGRSDDEQATSRALYREIDADPRRWGHVARLVRRERSTALARIAAAARRFFAPFEPWYDWGRINVFRLDARTEEDRTEREVRYVELQWLGLHIGFQIGRAPAKARC